MASEKLRGYDKNYLNISTFGKFSNIYAFTCLLGHFERFYASLSIPYNFYNFFWGKIWPGNLKYMLHININYQ